MNIVILSGGSGNDALICGIKQFYQDADINVIINAYDSGKSTGICRNVTNTLGVSDIRKNHIRMYKASNKNYDKRIAEFMEVRYDFTKGEECKEMCDKLNNWGLSQFVGICKSFFNNKIAQDFKYIDFNVANVIYSQMFLEYGYDKTNEIMCNLLQIPNFVKLNSFDNVYINAITKNGNILIDEGDIVEYKNSNDPIVEIKYQTANKSNGLNEDAIQLINKANLIIISTGTFWSSIYPTLFYKDFYKYINKATCKKIWLMNNEQDKDSYGVGSNYFISILQQKGLNLNDFIILENLDADEILKQNNEKYKIIQKSMGNINGKHDKDHLVIELLKAYYGIDTFSDYDNIIFDFDDTIWARNSKDLTYSVENIKLINEFLPDKSIIISGNTYDSICSKLYQVFGTNLKNLKIDNIWADANTTLYSNGKIKDVIYDLMIDNTIATCIINDLAKYDLPIKVYQHDKGIFNIKIKPLSNRERNILVDFINTLFIKNGNTNCKAVKAGITTIDILSYNNNKTRVFEHLNLQNKKTLYIGDEIDFGNDTKIAKMCSDSIKTSGVKETNVLLKLYL